MGARRYGPDIAGFLQQDMYHGALANLGLSLDPLTQNRYALAGGNPISYVETDGHRPTENGDGGASPSNPPSSCHNQSASVCEPKPESPSDVSNKVTYPNGTVLITHRDGTTSINGYVLPAGYKDAEAIAERIDQDWNEPEPAPTYLIPGLTARACTPEICTLEFKQKTDTQRWQIMGSMPSPEWLFAGCGGASAAAYMSGSATLCVAVASDGLAVYLSPGVTQGATAGYFAGGGIAISNRDIESQRGPFTTYEVSGKPVVGFDAAYATSGDVWNAQLLVGGGLGGGVSGGTTTTIVWHIIG